MTDVSEQPSTNPDDEMGGGGHTTHLGGFTFMDGTGGKIASATGHVTGLPNNPDAVPPPTENDPTTKEVDLTNANGTLVSVELYNVTSIDIQWTYTPGGVRAYTSDGDTGHHGAMPQGMNNLTVEIAEVAEPSPHCECQFTPAP